MKKTTTFFLALVFLFSALACNNVDCVNGSGKQTTKTRNVGPFSKIQAGGSVKIVLKQDSIQEVKIVADDNIQERIKTRVSGDALIFEMDGNFCNSGPITLYITSKNMTGVSTSGSVELSSAGKINTTDFELDLSGDSKVNLDINAANMITEASGSSTILLRGQASNHRVELSGEGNIEALDFVVGNYKINTSGSSEMRINVLSNLDVQSSGASEIAYRGAPKYINNDKSGASTLKKIE